MMKSAKELQANCLYDEEDEEDEVNDEGTKGSKKRKANDDTAAAKKKKKQEAKAGESVKVIKSKVYKNVDGESVAVNRKTKVVTKVETKTSSKTPVTSGFAKSDLYVNPDLAELLSLQDGDYKRTTVYIFQRD